jgi:hypothetical protein
LAHIADKRREGRGKQHKYAGAIKGVYGAFLFQHPSMPEYRQRVETEGRTAQRADYSEVERILPQGGRPIRIRD